MILTFVYLNVNKSVECQLCLSSEQIIGHAPNTHKVIQASQMMTPKGGAQIVTHQVLGSDQWGINRKRPAAEAYDADLLDRYPTPHT